MMSVKLPSGKKGQSNETFAKTLVSNERLQQGGIVEQQIRRYLNPLHLVEYYYKPGLSLSPLNMDHMAGAFILMVYQHQSVKNPLKVTSYVTYLGLFCIDRASDLRVRETGVSSQR